MHRSLALLLLLTFVACAKQDPLYCDEETPCTDPTLPFCDLTGVHPDSDGHGRTCIAWPWDGGNGPDGAGSGYDALPARTVLIATSAEGAAETVYGYDGEGLTMLWSSPEVRNTQGVAWGDYDGDGDPDLAVAGNGYPSSVYRNDGSSYTEVWNNPNLFDYNLAAAWHDFDRDGDLDLAFGGLSTRVYRNDGGVLSETFTTSIGGVGLAWGDMDGDKDGDLAVCRDGTLKLLQFNGSTFVELELVDSMNDDYTDVAAFDFDTDGDIDLVLANTSGTNPILRNTGSGFTELNLPGNHVSHALAWGDYDNDGRPDLLVANDGPNQLLRNDSGILVEEWTTTESHQSESVAWIDYDSDGDLDFVVGNRDAPDQLYRNDDGTFSEVWTSPINAFTTGIAAVAY